MIGVGWLCSNATCMYAIMFLNTKFGSIWFKMYLHNTNEVQILYYFCFKPIGGLHDFEMIFCIELSLIPLLYMKIRSQWKGILFFSVHFTTIWP